MAREMITWSGYLRDNSRLDAAHHRHRRRLDLRQVVRHRPARPARRRQGADGQGLCPPVLRGDQGRGPEARPAAAQAPARAGPRALRTGGARHRPGRRRQGRRAQEVGQHGPVDQPPLLGGGARLVLSRRAGGRRRSRGDRDRRPGRPAVQLRRGRRASQDAAAGARRLCRLPRRRRLHRVLRGALQRAAPAGHGAGERRSRRGHHRARAAQGHRRPLPRAAAPARRLVRADRRRCRVRSDISVRRTHGSRTPRPQGHRLCRQPRLGACRRLLIGARGRGRDPGRAHRRRARAHGRGAALSHRRAGHGGGGRRQHR